MAPEKVENVYCRSPLVAQAYLHGDSLQSKCVAIIVPDEEELMVWAKKHQITGTFTELCKNEVQWNLFIRTPLSLPNDIRHVMFDV